MKTLIRILLSIILPLNLFITEAYSQQHNKNTYIAKLRWGNIFTHIPTSIASYNQSHYATWERLNFAGYSGRPANFSILNTSDSTKSFGLYHSIGIGTYKSIVNIHNAKKKKFLLSKYVLPKSYLDPVCGFFFFQNTENPYHVIWENSFCGPVKFFNDSTVFGIDTLFQNDMYATSFSIYDGVLKWTEYIQPIFSQHQIDFDSYQYHEFFIRQDTAHAIFHHRQDPSLKVRLVFSQLGFEKLYIEQHPYDRHWYFTGTRLGVKRRVLYENTSIYDGKADGTLDVFDQLDRRILSFSLSNWADDFSFLPEKVFWEPDNTLSIFYRYRRKGSPRVFTALMNIDLQDQVNWCMDYWVPDFRVIILDVIKTDDGGFFMFLEQHGVTYHVMKTDKRGRVYESENGITYTRSNCSHTELPRRTDILLFPNPASGRFTLQTGEYGLLQIVNLAGQVVFETAIQDYTTEVLFGRLPAGMYIARFIGESGSSASEKLVVY